MDLTKLFDFSYLTYRYPEAGFSWPIRITLLIIFIGTIVFAIYTHKKIKRAKTTKKMWQKLQVWAWTTGIIGLLLMSFREIRAIYISSRIYLLIFIIIIIIWLIAILIYKKNKLPDKESQIKKEQEFDKWLPKKK